jgi:signal transduction histidine kinase
MLGESTSTLFAASSQVEGFADIVVRQADQIAFAWALAAASLLAQDGQEATPLLLERLRAEATGVLCALPGLMGPHLAAPSPETPLLSGLAATGPHHSAASLGYRLCTLLVECAMTAVAPLLPDSWSAQAGIDLHRRLSSAIRRAAGITAGDLAADTEAALFAQRQRLERTLGRAVAVAEGERQRIARDVHDVLAQSLAAASIQCQAARSLAVSSPEQAAAAMRQVQQAIDATTAQVREIIFGLGRALPEGMGLAAAIRIHAEQILPETVTLTIHESGPLDGIEPELETVAFRVVQETLSNAHRHAHATHVAVSLAEEPDCIRVSVTDNGAGFDGRTLESATGQGHHYGLEFMRERVTLVGGRLRIDSAPGRGTTVEIVLPRG